MKIKISKSKWEEMGKKAGWKENDTTALPEDINNFVTQFNAVGTGDVEFVEDHVKFYRFSIKSSLLYKKHFELFVGSGLNVHVGLFGGDFSLMIFKAGV